jgi:hypothetical protein
MLLQIDKIPYKWMRMRQQLLSFFLLLFTTFTCLPTLAQQSSCAPTTGLVAYYPLDELPNSTTAQDVSGQLGAGQLSGGMWQPTGGYDGRGALLVTGGTSYLDLPLMWQPTTYSISFWIKPTNRFDWSQGIGAMTGWGAFVFHSTSTGGIYVGTDVPTRIYLGDVDLVQLNVWQQFVFTFDNGVGAIYKNGKLLAKKGGMSLPQPWQGLQSMNVPCRRCVQCKCRLHQQQRPCRLAPH